MEVKEQDQIKKKNISAKICKKILKEVNNFDNIFFSHLNKTKNIDNSNKKKRKKEKTLIQYLVQNSEVKLNKKIQTNRLVKLVKLLEMNGIIYHLMKNINIVMKHYY